MLRIAFLAILGFSGAVEASVWSATNNWDAGWELKYSEWVKSEFNEDFYLNNPWGPLSTDCADALYGARIAFSFENQLPFKLVSTGISNQTTKFDKYSDPVARVKAFMRYVFDTTSTKMLPQDTYPVAIKREDLIPGTLWTRNSQSSESFLIALFAGPNAASGHSEMVKDVSPSGVIYLIGSTVPSKVRSLIIGNSFVFAPNEDSKTGFRRWIWPQNIGQATQSMGYSLEQYSMGYQSPSNSDSDSNFGGASQRGNISVSDFANEVQQKLALQEESQEDYIKRATTEMCSLLHLRKEVISDAINYQKKHGHSCMNVEAYDNFSTPSRDKRLKQVLDDTFDLLFAVPFFVGAEEKVEKISSYLESCPALVTVDGQKTISAVQAMTQLAKGNWSSDPNESELSRWGLAQVTGQCSK